MLALIAPALAQIPSGDPFRKALLLAVPVSANVAGMSTPIASPPNAIAVSYLARENAAIGFLGWMATAVPIVIVLLLLTWWRLQRLFPAAAEGGRVEFPDTRLTRRGALVLVIAMLTFACWVTEPWHGVSAAIVAVLPVTLLFATGSFSREDVNSLDWDVLILIAGGLTLGYSLQATGLDGRLAALVPAGSSDLRRLIVVAGATLGLGTFFSNTAIASMLMPVAMIAASSGGSVNVAGYALTVALTASLSMALPVSTPPNAMTYARGGLSSGDFLRTAGFIGVMGAVLVIVMVVYLR
jgi:sodium-dependent dicarboxylate transporter 2/3/5